MPTGPISSCHTFPVFRNLADAIMGLRHIGASDYLRLFTPGTFELKNLLQQTD